MTAQRFDVEWRDGPEAPWLTEPNLTAGAATLALVAHARAQRDTRLWVVEPNGQRRLAEEALPSLAGLAMLALSASLADEGDPRLKLVVEVTNQELRRQAASGRLMVEPITATQTLAEGTIDIGSVAATVLAAFDALGQDVGSVIGILPINQALRADYASKVGELMLITAQAAACAELGDEDRAWVGEHVAAFRAGAMGHAEIAAFCAGVIERVTGLPKATAAGDYLDALAAHAASPPPAPTTLPYTGDILPATRWEWCRHDARKIDLIEVVAVAPGPVALTVYYRSLRDGRMGYAYEEAFRFNARPR